MRDAVSLLDQCSGSEHITTQTVLSSMGLAGNARTASLLDAVSRGDTAGALGIFSELWRDGKDPATFLGELSTLMRDILMSELAPKNGGELLSGGYDSAALSELARKFTQAQLLGALRSIQEALVAMRSGQSPRTVAEMCIIGLCEPDLSDNIDNLRSRISVLENKLANGIVAAAPANAPRPAPVAQAAMPAEPALVPDEPPEVIDLPWDDEPASPPPHEDYDLPPIPEEEPPLPTEEAPAVAPPVQEASGDIWSEIIADLSGKIGMGDYNIISDSFHTAGKLAGNKLTIYAKNPFALAKVSAAGLQEQIRASAQRLIGAHVTINVVEGDGDAAPQETGDLEMLGKFGNVKFE
jgi:DNA polymerase-3 subunit gamma/tau